MGSTESKVDKTRLQMEYRLVRRFISEFYGGGEITIIEHKQTKEQVALREMVNQFNPQMMVKLLESRKLMAHRNLIQMRTYWVESDLNICSNLFKLYAIFEYHENSLQDYLSQQHNKALSDAEVVDFVKQMVAALSYLQRNQMVYLLAGPRSVMLAQEQDTSLREIQQTDYSNRYSYKKLNREGSDRQKCSLAELNRKYFADDCLIASKAQVGEKGGKKKVYKLFEPFEGLSSTRTFHNLQSYMQVPLHPQLAACTHEQLMLPESLIKLQNMFTVVLIALAMAEGCEIFQIDVLKGGRLSIEKLKKRIEKLEETHPRTSSELLKMLAVRGVQREEPFGRGGGHLSLKLKDFSFIMRREEAKQSQKQNMMVEIKAPLQKGNRTFSKKRISLMHG